MTNPISQRNFRTVSYTVVVDATLSVISFQSLPCGQICSSVLMQQAVEIRLGTQVSAAVISVQQPLWVGRMR